MTIKQNGFQTLFIAVFMLMGISQLQAQEVLIEEEIEIEEEEGDMKHFRIGLVLAHTYIPKGTSEGTQVTSIPAYGLDLEYWIYEKWGIGLHNEIELEMFEVETNESSFIEREYPVVVTLDALYKPYKELIFVFGYGVEFEKTENLNLIRFGAEYELDLGKHWDMSPSFTYDYRFGNYGTYAIGIGVGKKF